jgi:hypothetical protein
MKIPFILTLVLFLSAIQVTAVAYDREASDYDSDMRDYRGEEDMRDPRREEDMRDYRGEEDMRDPRREEDMRDYRGETPAYDDRPWRETLKKCREMKKAGKLSRSMKEECKAARELRKASKQ